MLTTPEPLLSSFPIIPPSSSSPLCLCTCSLFSPHGHFFRYFSHRGHWSLLHYSAQTSSPFPVLLPRKQPFMQPILLSLLFVFPFWSPNQSFQITYFLFSIFIFLLLQIFIILNFFSPPLQNIIVFHDNFVISLKLYSPTPFFHS